MAAPSASPFKTPKDFICPNCGKWVESLAEETGWCDDCSPIFPQVKVRVEHWLEANANHIEHYLAQGNTLTKAINLAAKGTRPTCVVCRLPIHRGSRGSIFCRRYPICRRYSRRYVYLYTKKGLSKAEALGKILRELEG